MSTTKKHIGRNIGRIRELRGLKQEALAYAIGLSQQTISNIEKSENVDDDKLKMISKELDVSMEAIKNFSEEGMIGYFTSFKDSTINGNQVFGNNCSFNPLDKLLEVYAEKHRLYQENQKLYERLVAAEKDKIAYLEKSLRNK